jgi:hypothetical protein
MAKTEEIEVSRVERLTFHKVGWFIDACARSFGILWLPDILRSHLENLPCDMQREMKELLGSKFALDNTLSISPDEKNCLPYDMQREMKE